MTPLLAVRSGEAELAVHVRGAGTPVVFLHAGVADRRMWDAQVAALDGDRFRAIAYDRRGFGQSVHVDESWSHVDDLARVLDAATGGEPVVLVGCSQGGRIAIDAALAHPARVRGLVLVAPAVTGAPEPASYPPAIEAWIARVEESEASGDVDRTNALEAHAWLDGPLAPEGRVGGAARDLFLAMNGIALRAEARGTEDEPPPAWDRVGSIAVPALVAWGDLDFPEVIDTCSRLASSFPGARRHVFRGAAHLPMLEQPAAFERVLLAFCASCRE